MDSQLTIHLSELNKNVGIAISQLHDLRNRIDELDDSFRIFRIESETVRNGINDKLKLMNDIIMPIVKVREWTVTSISGIGVRLITFGMMIIIGATIALFATGYKAAMHYAKIICETKLW